MSTNIVSYFVELYHNSEPLLFSIGHTNATSRIGVSQREAERRGPHVAANQSQPIQITLHSLPDPVQHNHHRSKPIIQTPFDPKPFGMLRENSSTMTPQPDTPALLDAIAATREAFAQAKPGSREELLDLAHSLTAALETPSETIQRIGWAEVILQSFFRLSVF